jgi:hypothetical protein
MKLSEIKFPLDRSGYCKMDSCYHIGTIGPAECSGMRIDGEHSIDNLILDVWANEDSQDNKDIADFILNAINTSILNLKNE